MKNKNSMLYWYPKIKDLDIPQPKTEFVLLSEKEYYETMESMPKSISERVEKIIKEKFKLPVFIRTDQASGKHSWKDTCYYDGEKLGLHLFEICESNHCADIMGLYFRAIVVREFIAMASQYTAFWGNMPINPERRYFIKDGKIICHHFYWIKEAIRDPSVKNWQELSDEMNKETEDEIKILTNYSKMVADVIDGFWSVDFCKARNGQWYLIDMATGDNSWHLEHQI